MKKRPVLLVIGIVLSLMLLFAFSVFVAGLFFDDGSSLVLGEGIGVVEVNGVITDSKETIKQLHAFRDNRQIKAIVLRIDSPGGVVGPTQEIYEEIGKLAAKKKVVVSMGSVAASGGYYIAAPAHLIFANPGTVTGSIGVLMKLTNIEELLGNIGLKSYILKSGRFKDTGSPVRTMTREDKAVLQAVVDSMHGQFVKAVAKGRKMPHGEAASIADGRIFSGEQALALKLVDKLGNLQDAVAEAGKLAGIEGEPKVVYPPEKKSFWLDMLMEGAVGKLSGYAGQAAGFKANYEFDGL